MQSPALLWRVVALILSLTLASCQSAKDWETDVRRVDRSEDVANVFVSAYPAVPWTAVAAKLEPKNNLSTADARAMAAVTTQSYQTQFLSTLAAGLAVGLPSRTSSLSTVLNADGTQTTTGTRKLESGAIPSSSGASGVQITDSSVVSDLTKALAPLGVDGSTQLMGGAGLFQLAAVLDNQISNAITPKGYQAHLITFQVNLQPKGRNLPYDAYVNVTLMPAAWSQTQILSKAIAADAAELSPIIVYPLVIADAMESSSAGRSVEVIRQAALALSGIVSNIGVSGSISGGTDGLKTLLGSDRNSLVTVGRISDHTLRIRLGAQQQGSRRLALVPRTQNISVVVFTKAGPTQPEFIERLFAITQTTFLDVDTGKAVDATRNSKSGRDELQTKVDSILENYGYEDVCLGEKDEQSPLDMLRALDRGDYSTIEKCLKEKQKLAQKVAIAVSATDGTGSPASEKGATKTNSETVANHGAPHLTVASSSMAASTATGDSASEAGADSSAVKATVPAPAPDPNTTRTVADTVRLRRIAAELMTVQTDSRFSKVMIQLSDFNDKLVAPPYLKQTALLADDKSASKVVLGQGSNLDANLLAARLNLFHNNKWIEIVASSLEVDVAGKSVTASFPPLSTNKLTSHPDADPKKPDIEEDASLIRVVLEHAGQPASMGPKFVAIYPVQLVSSKPDSPGNPISSGSMILVADSTGTARLTLFVGEWDAKKLGALSVRVTGADIRSVDPSIALDAAQRAVPVSAPSVITLTLGNLTSAQPVQISTLAKKTVIGSPLTLAVESIQNSIK